MQVTLAMQCAQDHPRFYQGWLDGATFEKILNAESSMPLIFLASFNRQIQFWHLTMEKFLLSNL